MRESREGFKQYKSDIYSQRVRALCFATWPLGRCVKRPLVGAMAYHDASCRFVRGSKGQSQKSWDVRAGC